MSMTDFGSKLREARERRGISLRQIADSTKISKSALDALERNDISKLPGGIFSRAFVRSYAAAVGLDPEQTVREFLDRFQAEPAPAAPRPTAMTEEESNFESQQRMAGVVLIIVLISIPVVIAILYFSLRSRGAESVPPAAAAYESTPSPLPPAAVPHPADATPAGPVAARETTPPAAAAPPGVMTVEVHPTGPCWISATVDGTRVFSRVMQPGEKEILKVRDAAIFEIGDAGAFAFSIDGRPAKSLGDAGQVKTARITKETVAQFLR